ncbi:MAG: DUF6600 domain-containing protein [Blastocatellia bacterium]
MKRVLPVFLTLLCFFLFANPIFAQTPEANSDAIEAEDDVAAGRVIRVSFVEGDVSFQRGGTTEWAAVIENLPLFAGDQIYAGKDARVELQIGRGSYIRLSENTALTVTELRDDAVQFEIPAGMAFVRVEQLATAFQRFEVDTPNAALLLQQDGLYRVNVRGDNDSEVIVRRGAAEVATDDGSFKLREGRRLLIDTSASGRLEVAYDTTQDDWDIWSTTRDATINSQYINTAPDYVTQYETTYSDFYGVSDLSSYGSWSSDPTYGNCWRPYGVGYGWVPYRQGQWIWTPRAGWTWVSSEPWGWAPYHYGRWVFTSSFGWAWVPGYGRSTGGYNNYQWRAYYRWRPALVGFFDAPSPRGHYVGWYPLAPGQRWHRPDGQRLGGDRSHLQYPTAGDTWRRPGRGTFAVPPHDGRGVTLLPVEGFNRSDRTKLRPVTPDQDLSNWIKRGARPGLPEIKPAPVAIAPVTRDERRYRIAIPPNEIIRRPVVTRNRPTDSEATVNSPRERRLITPRAPALSSDDLTRREKRQRGDEQRTKPPAVARPAEGENSNPSYQKPNRQSGEAKPRIMPADRAEGDSSRSERKARRGGDDSAQPVDNRSGNDSSGERHKRPAYTPPPQDPAAGTSEAGVRERKQRDEEQIRQRDEERARQRDEERQRRAEEDRARQRDEEVNRQRNEERQRPHEAERQQRQNEERARQQQEEHQRQQEADRARQPQEERQHRNDEERNRQRNEERVRDQAPREKPPAQNQEQRQTKEERRAEPEQRKKP